jgi:hypothetical protein
MGERELLAIEETRLRVDSERDRGVQVIQLQAMEERRQMQQTMETVETNGEHQTPPNTNSHRRQLLED